MYIRVARSGSPEICFMFRIIIIIFRRRPTTGHPPSSLSTTFRLISTWRKPKQATLTLTVAQGAMAVGLGGQKVPKWNTNALWLVAAVCSPCCYTYFVCLNAGSVAGHIGRGPGRAWPPQEWLQATTAVSICGVAGRCGLAEAPRKVCSLKQTESLF